MSKQIDEVMGLVNEVQKNRVCAEMSPSNKEHFNYLADKAFVAISDKLRELLPVWIDATKQKPEDGEQVWASMVDSNGKSTFQAYAIWEDGDWFLDVMDSGDLYSRQKAIKDGLDACTVKCWMPLPKAPE